MGFSRVELSHGIRITLVPGILKAVEEGVVAVGSIHNFCPLPMGVMNAAPNFFQPSAANDQERDQWLRQTKRSIDFAAQVGASVLVCHLGSVKYLWLEPDRHMTAYREAHPDAVRSGDKAYLALVEKALQKLRKRMPPFWQRTKDSVKAVLDHAASKNVRLALENRERFEELPVDADFPARFWPTCLSPQPPATGMTPAMPISRRGWGSSATGASSRRTRRAFSGSISTTWTPRATTTRRSARARSISAW